MEIGGFGVVYKRYVFSETANDGRYKMNDEFSALSGFWMDVCEEIRGESDSLYELIHGTFVPLEVSDSALKLGAPDSFLKDWIMNSYSELLNESVEKVAGHPLQIEFEYGYLSPEKENPETETKELQEDDSEPIEKTTPVASVPLTAERCLPEHTFSTFVVGEENRYAYVAATMAVQSPGKQNPLYIYGGPGMGKTHLIQAVANEMKTLHPEKVIRYITCEEFLNEYLGSLRSKTDFKFRDHFRNVDMLLVDDVHFLTGNKVQLQEEFFNTFNALYNAGKQIILTSDKPPAEIPGLEKRLVSRFQSGLTMQITASTYETRLAILHQMQDTNASRFCEDVLNFLAAHITSNFRPLKSALTRLIVYADLGEQITVRSAEEKLLDVLNKEAEEKSSRLTSDAILKAVAEHFELQPRELTSSKRTKNIALPRMIAMYLCRKLTNNSQQDIGTVFGGRTHATVIHAIGQIEKLCQENEEMRRQVFSLERHFKDD